MTRQDELNEAWCNYRGKCSTEILHALAFALRWCDQHPAWISVEDELPKETNMYIVVHHNVVCTMLWYDNLEEWAEIYVDENECVQSRQMDGVTHWMALPSPPEHFADVSKKISGSSEIQNNHTKTIEKGGEQ